MNNGRLEQALNYLFVFEEHIHKDKEQDKISEEAYIGIQEELNRLTNYRE